MKRLVLVVGLLFVLLSGITVLGTQENPGRYRIEGYNPVLFRRVDILPFTELRPMCYDSSGWCDIVYLEGEDEETWFRLDDYRYLKAGIVNSVQYNGDLHCYLFWWQDEYGADGQPHPDYAVWVDCSVINTFDWFPNQ